MKKEETIVVLSNRHRMGRLGKTKDYIRNYYSSMTIITDGSKYLGSEQKSVHTHVSCVYLQNN